MIDSVIQYSPTQLRFLLMTMIFNSLNINGWEFMISLGFLGAAWYVKNEFNHCHPFLQWSTICLFDLASLASLCSVRIANELGRGDAKATKFSIKVLLSTSIVIGIFFWVLCLVFGSKIGYLFSEEKEVAESVSDLSLLLAFSVLLNSIYPVLSGKSWCCFYSRPDWTTKIIYHLIFWQFMKFWTIVLYFENTQYMRVMRL